MKIPSIITASLLAGAALFTPLAGAASAGVDDPPKISQPTLGDEHGPSLERGIKRHRGWHKGHGIKVHVDRPGDCCNILTLSGAPITVHVDNVDPAPPGMTIQKVRIYLTDPTGTDIVTENAHISTTPNPHHWNYWAKLMLPAKSTPGAWSAYAVAYYLTPGGSIAKYAAKDDFCVSRKTWFGYIRIANQSPGNFQISRVALYGLHKSGKYYTPLTLRRVTFWWRTDEWSAWTRLGTATTRGKKAIAKLRYKNPGEGVILVTYPGSSEPSFAYARAISDTETN